MRWHLSLIIAVALVCGFACKKDVSGEAGGSAGTPTSASAPAGDPAAPAEPVAEPNIPVPADFEEEAQKDITAENYEKALEDLAGELEAQE